MDLYRVLNLLRDYAAIVSHKESFLHRWQFIRRRELRAERKILVSLMCSISSMIDENRWKRWEDREGAD